MSNEPIDVEAEPAQALTVREANQAIAASPEPPKPQVTAAQAKVEAVANLTFKAYERAATLALTPEEVKALQVEFPDEAFKPGAAGKENLIYIEHAFLRDRLNQVIGIGQWALIPRNRWAEDFKTSNGKPASRVYVEAMLVVRGAFVAEAVGEMEYYPNNASQNYGDAVEGAKTAALRRCCKEFGIGLQAWKKDFCDGWWARKRGTPPAATQGAPRAQSAPAATAPSPTKTTPEIFPTVTVTAVVEKSGVKKTTGKPWTAWFVKFSDGMGELEAGTFDGKIATLANELANTGENASLCVKPGYKPGTREIVSLLRVDAPPPDQDQMPMEFDDQGNAVGNTP